jgi:hypothetical protein
MADDTDPWTQRFQNIDKLITQPAAPAATSTPPAATSASTSSGTPPAEPMWDPFGLRAAGRDVATAVTGGMYNVGANIARNLGATPNQLPPDAQAAMAAHPYATGAGNLIGGTAAAIPLALGAEAAAPAIGIGTGLGGSVLTGAATGAAQNALTGNPDESLARRAGTGAALGGVLGGVANRVGGWFGAGRSIESDVAAAAKTAQQEGVTDIGASNLPGGNVKAMGATPTYAQSGQIDNAVSKILGENVPDFKSANLNAVKNSIGGDVSAAAKSGQINAQPGGAFDQALTQVQQFANANGAGSSITPLVNQIRARIKNGVISGQDFDNLVGAGSPLHDLAGDDNPFVKQAAQALDKVMDSGFQASSPPGAYDAWVDARTRYRMLAGVEKAILPNGHINPTALFNSVLNRFTDMKGVPVTNDPLVGRMGQFAGSIRTLFGGGAAQQQAAPSLWRTLGIGGAGGAAAQVIPELMSGNALNPENFLTPTALAAGGAAGLTMAGRYLGQLYQQSPRFVNALINAGGAPITNQLQQYAPTIGTQVFPQRQAQP